MKKYAFISVVLLFVLSACSAKQIIRNNPEFTHNKWISQKVGILPALIPPTSKKNLKQDVISSKIEKILVKRKLNHAQFIPPLYVEREMASTKTLKDYNIISNSYKKLKTWEERKNFKLNPDNIRNIGKKIGLDKIVVLKVIKKLSSSDEDSSGRDRTKYLCLTQMQIYDIDTGKIVFKHTTYGKYIYVEHKSSFLSLLTLPAHISSDYNGVYYQKAFESGFHRNLINFNDQFIGECVTGNCMNGPGKFIIYYPKSHNNEVKDQMYNGLWRDNLAHGKGTYYYTKNGIRVKYSGIWEKGELVKKKAIYYLKDGEWIKTSSSALGDIIN